MPLRDGTGPEGQGAQTGRALGGCVPENEKPMPNPAGDDRQRNNEDIWKQNQ